MFTVLCGERNGTYSLFCMIVRIRRLALTSVRAVAGTLKGRGAYRSANGKAYIRGGAGGVNTEGA